MIFFGSKFNVFLSKKYIFPTFGAASAVRLHGEALLVVVDPHHAALLRKRRVGGAAGQHHVDGATFDLDVPSLSDVDVLREVG